MEIPSNIGIISACIQAQSNKLASMKSKLFSVQRRDSLCYGWFVECFVQQNGFDYIYI